MRQVVVGFGGVATTRGLAWPTVVDEAPPEDPALAPLAVDAHTINASGPRAEPYAYAPGFELAEQAWAGSAFTRNAPATKKTTRGPITKRREELRSFMPGRYIKLWRLVGVLHRDRYFRLRHGPKRLKRKPSRS
jgi:hypothetical protein